MSYLGTFLYLWYPGNWQSTQKYDPNIFGTGDPQIELYSSKDLKTLTRQTQLMQSCGIDFSISSWWGQGSPSDVAFNVLINQVKPSVKTCIYYEMEGTADVPQSTIISDINYIKSKYANSSSYFKINNKPVVFVYNIGNDISKTKKWKLIKDQTGIYLVLKIFPGWTSYTPYSDSWHEYAPSTAYSVTALPFSSFVSPGFYKYNEPSPRLSRDINRFKADIQKLKMTNAQFQLIETWNELGEGTIIEPSIQFGTQFLDAISGNILNPLSVKLDIY